MAKTKPAPRPVKVGKAYTFAEVLAEAQRRMEAEEAKVAAMTPEQRAAYEEEERKRAIEVEGILKQLRGPGFIEL